MAGEVERLQELVDKYDNIVFFGGAGVSTCLLYTSPSPRDS